MTTKNQEKQRIDTEELRKALPTVFDRLSKAREDNLERWRIAEKPGFKHLGQDQVDRAKWDECTDDRAQFAKWDGVKCAHCPAYMMKGKCSKQDRARMKYARDAFDELGYRRNVAFVGRAFVTGEITPDHVKSLFTWLCLNRKADPKEFFEKMPIPK